LALIAVGRAGNIKERGKKVRKNYSKRPGSRHSDDKHHAEFRKKPPRATTACLVLRKKLEKTPPAARTRSGGKLERRP